MEAFTKQTSSSWEGLNFKTLSESCCEGKQGFKVPFIFAEFSVTEFMNLMMVTLLSSSIHALLAAKAI